MDNPKRNDLQSTQVNTLGNTQPTQVNTLGNTQPTQVNTLGNTQPTQVNTLEDEYDLTWGRLHHDLFIYVASLLSSQRDLILSNHKMWLRERDLILLKYEMWLRERDILSLSRVCKKMNRNFLRELCYVTCYYPNYPKRKLRTGSKKKLRTESFPPLTLIHKAFPFYLHSPSVSYTSDWWRMVEDPPLIIHRLIVNLQSEETYSKPPQNLWDLSKLYSLVINMPERFDQNQQLSTYNSYSWTDRSLLKELVDQYQLPSLEEHLDQYQLPSLKKLVLLEMDITPETWNHLSFNLESIELVNCQLEPPRYINLGKLEYLEKFTIYLKSRGDTSCESCLDLTKCTMKFPGISKRLKFKDNLMLKVL
jgi:hypothetical protein